MSPGRWQIRRRLLGRLWPVSVETEVDEEIGAHIELHTRRLMAQGFGEHAAREEAQRRFGDLTRVRGECRDIRNDMEADMRRAELLQEVKMDTSFALRTFRRTPVSTIVILLTSAVSQRSREIAIRVALGGRPGALRWMVMREGLFVALIGMALGVLGSVAMARALSSLLYDVAPTDVVTYAVIALLLLAVVLIAAHGPMRRATRVDPMLALRE